MGTTYEIRIAGNDLDASLRQRLEEETTRRLSQLDGWMSNWNPESEVSRFNAHHDTTDFAVSAETAEIVAFALELNETSGGAFDISVGPLVARWGFGSGARVDEKPSDVEIERLRSHMGAATLRVNRGDLFFKHHKRALDFVKHGRGVVRFFQHVPFVLFFLLLRRNLLRGQHRGNRTNTVRRR